MSTKGEQSSNPLFLNRCYGTYQQIAFNEGEAIGFNVGVLPVDMK